MPGHEYPVPRVTAQKNLLPVGIEPGTSRSEVRLTRIHFALMPGHEHPVLRVMAQKNLLPVGIEPGTSRLEVRLTNHLASRTGVNNDKDVKRR